MGDSIAGEAAGAAGEGEDFADGVAGTAAEFAHAVA